MNGQQTPERLAGVAAGQMEARSCSELADAATDLEQAQTQGVELETRMATGGEPAAQRVQQPVDGGVQEEAELVGPEAVVAQAGGEARALEVLYPQLGLAPVHVPVIQRLRLVRAGGDDEAGVGAFGQGRGLVDDAARVRPTLGLVRC